MQARPQQPLAAPGRAARGPAARRRPARRRRPRRACCRASALRPGRARSPRPSWGCSRRTPLCTRRPRRRSAASARSSSRCPGWGLAAAGVYGTHCAAAATPVSHHVQHEAKAEVRLRRRGRLLAPRRCTRLCLDVSRAKARQRLACHPQEAAARYIHVFYGPLARGPFTPGKPLMAGDARRARGRAQRSCMPPT